MAMVNFITLMEIFMKESGKTIRPMEKGFTFMPMELNTSDNGKKTNNMAKELKLGIFFINIKNILICVFNIFKCFNLKFIMKNICFKRSDGARYEGEYFEGKKYGKGILKFADGSSYEGDFYMNEI